MTDTRKLLDSDSVQALLRDLLASAAKLGATPPGELGRLTQGIVEGLATELRQSLQLGLQLIAAGALALDCPADKLTVRGTLRPQWAEPSPLLLTVEADGVSVGNLEIHWDDTLAEGKDHYRLGVVVALSKEAVIALNKHAFTNDARVEFAPAAVT